MTALETLYFLLLSIVFTFIVHCFLRILELKHNQGGKRLFFFCCVIGQSKLSPLLIPQDIHIRKLKFLFSVLLDCRQDSTPAQPTSARSWDSEEFLNFHVSVKKNLHVNLHVRLCTFINLHSLYSCLQQHLDSYKGYVS